MDMDMANETFHKGETAFFEFECEKDETKMIGEVFIHLKEKVQTLFPKSEKTISECITIKGITISEGKDGKDKIAVSGVCKESFEKPQKVC